MIAIKIKTNEGSVIQSKNNLTEEGEILSFGKMKVILSFLVFIFISTALLYLEVLNQ